MCIRDSLKSTGIADTAYFGACLLYTSATHQLVKRMNAFDKVLTTHEVPRIDKRLRSIGGVRPPIPQGIDPTRFRGKTRPR